MIVYLIKIPILQVQGDQNAMHIAVVFIKGEGRLQFRCNDL